MSEKNLVSIFAGRSSQYLAEQICLSYGTHLGASSILSFSDGEFQPSFDENIRGRDVFIIQSIIPPTDNLFELLMMIDAAKRASAKNIVAVIPYLGFARQDRKDRPRVSIAAKLVANLLSAAGVTRIVTLDLHADQIQGFFDLPVDHLYASSVFIPWITKHLDLSNIIFASPDTGGTRRAAAYAKILDTKFVICYKLRSKPGEIGEMGLVGDVEDKDVILLDDIIDSAKTITMAANLIMKNGAKSVRAFCTHPVLSGEAYEKITNTPFTELVVTDTIPIKDDHPKIKIVSTAKFFAEVIKRVENNESINDLYNFNDLSKLSKLID